MTTPTHPQSTKKVRRDSIGGKRGDGHLRFARIRRPDPRNIRIGAPDAGLTAYGGLAGLGAFIRDLGVDESLRYRFGRLKAGPMVVYPMPAQMRLLIDAGAVGEGRVFGVEALSADPAVCAPVGRGSGRVSIPCTGTCVDSTRRPSPISNR